MEEQGVPAIAVVTTPFRNTGEAMAASWGKPGYAFLDTPHPIANLTEPDLDKRAGAPAGGGQPACAFLHTPHPMANLTEPDLDKRADELADACERWLASRA